MSLIESEKFIVYGGPDPVELLQGASLGEMMIKDLKLRPANIGLIDPVSETALSYQQILDQSVKVAVGLLELGVKKHDTVAIVSQNCLEYCFAMFGTIFTGATLAQFNPAYLEGELEHAIAMTKPKIIFVSNGVANKVSAVSGKLKCAEKIFVFDTYVESSQNSLGTPFSNLLNRHVSADDFHPEPVDKQNHVALVLLSSGTTGLPKGVQLTHANIMTTIAHSKEAAKLLDLPDQLVALAVTPLFHVLASVGLINMVTNNCRCVLLPKFDAVLFLQSIQKYRVNLMSVVPPLMVFLAKHPMVDNYDLSSLMTLFCGAAPLSKEIEDQVRKRLGIAFVRQGYGMTETTYVMLMQTGFENKAGCVGRVRMGQWVKVIDPDSGKVLGPNQRGELCFKGSLIMKGYVGKESAIDDDGWLHTGDIGYYDEDEDFFIVDRIKELIKYKGFQVAPAELEAILLRHPKVKDAAVIGLPDERVGELATAFVVKEPGVDVSEDEIVQFVAKHVSLQKQLHGGVRFISEIPKTATGKILRRILKDTDKSILSKL
ncbi:luciferin 4-monooxygenase-like isoform X2 [Topomyia yanbarensis]|nr:luciferin 4-monooxygenase-like isoform X2 [Topomyia yanbarensis]XP_058812709.1 luciferin 4-monooxygenase-like isoform X2 [Topomyia yanbarensis]XP_058812710.1 luciferin 4-monooxygenase-like isoform X2 [Topomyia yanbarensis]XP_058812711.1 luciferin 4-monooxygenase-like isoform X2 [Topomyia yanbarensis]XP_058812712.1 luciferin 4-monooxygenase-like isoform X2 [Topomyia yanbarensis]XP_058812713.1 luciferin 4-monooxygenase-like isoform X2 [Topomyia yanbarensis]XP_058812714.1 luciferin 4-monooxyg